MIPASQNAISLVPSDMQCCKSSSCAIKACLRRVSWVMSSSSSSFSFIRFDECSRCQVGAQITRSPQCTVQPPS